jgi:Leucine-rich repeat (LRR) protein
LDKEYPIEKRNEITKLEINKKDLEGKIELRNFFNLKILNCSDNKLTDLKLNDCRELTELICYLTPLTSTDFLLTLPNPEKLTILDLGDNNFAEQDLGFLQRFTGLEKLYL